MRWRDRILSIVVAAVIVSPGVAAIPQVAAPGLVTASAQVGQQETVVEADAIAAGTVSSYEDMRTSPLTVSGFATQPSNGTAIVHRDTQGWGVPAGTPVYLQWRDADGTLSPIYAAQTHAPFADAQNQWAPYAFQPGSWTDSTGRVRTYNPIGGGQQTRIWIPDYADPATGNRVTMIQSTPGRDQHGRGNYQRPDGGFYEHGTTAPNASLNNATNTVYNTSVLMYQTPGQEFTSLPVDNPHSPDRYRGPGRNRLDGHVWLEKTGMIDRDAQPATWEQNVERNMDDEVLDTLRVHAVTLTEAGKRRVDYIRTFPTHRHAELTQQMLQEERDNPGRFIDEHRVAKPMLSRDVDANGRTRNNLAGLYTIQFDNFDTRYVYAWVETTDGAIASGFTTFVDPSFKNLQDRDAATGSLAWDGRAWPTRYADNSSSVEWAITGIGDPGNAVDRTPPPTLADQYDPTYGGLVIRAGQTGTSVLDIEELPAGTIFAVRESPRVPDSWHVEIDQRTGALRVVLPDDERPGFSTVVEVIIRYPDGSIDQVGVPVFVAARIIAPTPSATPAPEPDPAPAPAPVWTENGRTEPMALTATTPVVLPNRGGALPGGETVRAVGQASANLRSDGALVVRATSDATPGDTAVVTVRDRRGDILDEVTFIIVKTPGAHPQPGGGSASGECIAAGAAAGLPLLLAIPLGLATLTNMPGLEPVRQALRSVPVDAEVVAAAGGAGLLLLSVAAVVWAIDACS